MIFGLLPADSIRVGAAIRVGIGSENRSNADRPAQGSAKVTSCHGSGLASQVSGQDLEPEQGYLVSESGDSCFVGS